MVALCGNGVAAVEEEVELVVRSVLSDSLALLLTIGCVSVVVVLALPGTTTPESLFEATLAGSGDTGSPVLVLLGSDLLVAVSRHVV